MRGLFGSLWRTLSRAGYTIEIDTRTLAVFRIMVGLLIIGDLIARSRMFTFFYTEDGVVPQELAQSRVIENAFSFFYFTTSTNLIAALFVLHGVVALLLIIGYRTRLAMVLSFLFVISLDHRNPLVLSHADSLFRLLTFWAMFLPLGERWSIDAIHRESPPRRSIVNLASAAILFQMLYMYLVNGLLKTQGDAWTGGFATPLVFGLDDMTWFLAGFMRNFPTLLGYGGWVWLFMLLASPLLFILPGRYRLLLVGMFVVAHSSFAVTVRIGAFAYVAIAGVLLFLPRSFWDDAELVARRFGIEVRLVTRAVNTLERFGHCLAARLPAFRFSYELPRPVTAGAMTVALISAIVAVFIVPSSINLHRYDVVAREPTKTERRIDSAARRIGAGQARWAVFAPYPRTEDRYYVFAALTADGDLLDVYNDRLLTFDRPYEQLQHQYANYRQRFYMNSIWQGGEHGEPGRLLAAYYCRTWPEERDIELTHIKMFLVVEHVTLETINLPYERERERRLIGRHACGDHEPVDFEVPEM